jgi:hypothetical protein
VIVESRNDISDMTAGVVAKLLKEIAGTMWRNAPVRSAAV